MKTQSRVAIAILLSLAAAMAWPNSADAEHCATLKAVSVQIQSRMPNAEIRTAEGPVATRLDAGISALIGQMVPAGGSYLIADMPGASVSYVVRFVNDCATHHGRFPARLVHAWISGTPA